MAGFHPEIALVPFIRGELTGTERNRVADHLDGCAQCREAAESFRSLLAALPARVEQELPIPNWTTYRAELRRKLAERALPRPRWWQTGLGWASLATAAALAVLVLWLAVPGSHGPVPQPDQLAFQQPMDTMQPTDITDVGLLRNYGVVERLDLLENYDVIEHLDEIRPAPQGSNATRS